MIRLLPSAKAAAMFAAIVVVAAAITLLALGTRAPAGATAACAPAAPMSAVAAQACCPSEPGCMGRPECTPAATPVSIATASAPVHASPVKTATDSAPGAAPASAGMIVAIDPEGGQLGMPTREQIEELSAAEEQALSRSTDGLVEENHPDGSVSIDLQGRFQEFAVIRIAQDGRKLTQCVEDPASALRALGATAGDPSSTPAPAALEVE